MVVADGPGPEQRHDITCTGGSAGANYTLGYVKAVLTVAPATVTVTADSKSIVYGDPDPTFTYATSGLVAGDALTTNPVCGVTGAHSSVGRYPITCTAGLL